MKVKFDIKLHLLFIVFMVEKIALHVPSFEIVLTLVLLDDNF